MQIFRDNPKLDKLLYILFVMVLLLGVAVLNVGCVPPEETVSRSGASIATAEVKTGSDGLTVEQRNIKKRVERDNLPGTMKYAYIQSGFSGKIIMFMTVEGKFTSSGKRLSPKTVNQEWSHNVLNPGTPVKINGKKYSTTEVLQDDGTYGSSTQYLYGFTTDDNRVDVYSLGSNIMYVSEKPLRFPDMELTLVIGSDK